MVLWFFWWRVKSIPPYHHTIPPPNHTPMNYIQFDFLTSDPDLRYILIAQLADLGIESFQEDDTLQAFLPAEQLTDVLAEAIRCVAEEQGVAYSHKELPAQNWNALWESNFEPIVISDFCGIRADFHNPIPNVRHEILINPQMAFGTGHHETTYMMMDMMSGISFSDRKVLDYGCGTGILAILAAFLGASPIDAVDIERPAYENTLENAQKNNVQQIRVLHGNLESVVDSGYAIILANINRNVILESLPALRSMIQPDGILLVSGILLDDVIQVTKVAEANGFNPVIQEKRGNWAAIQFVRL